MYLDVVDLRDFYTQDLGFTVREILIQRIAERWPTVTGERILGLGYATPYLGAFRPQAERVLAFMPATQGVVNWPADGPSTSALVIEDMLPLPDAAVDRVLLVHALEMAGDPRELLRELWRVLAPGGRLIAVVPNRRGLWARVDTSPFGYGRPFSRGQLTQLLRESLFSPIGWGEALHMMPLNRRRFRRSANTWEQIGRRLWPAFAGVIVVEATKQLYQGLPVTRRAVRAPAFRPALIPTPAGAGISPAVPAPPEG
ncbi:class I SAM-dependent methyltransferase [Chthonobacter rhizosphaerae]|uniref:class I SAM-dependent methyltransferase n=1 Tax=Chthonobacter rhizosphaerae TaxID=2735553 RepID=UPI0015EFC2B3|nr:methyltransferase domain-containing protein [Chthonobacter rhizosphaerae]